MHYCCTCTLPSEQARDEPTKNIREKTATIRRTSGLVTNERLTKVLHNVIDVRMNEKAPNEIIHIKLTDFTPHMFHNDLNKNYGPVYAFVSAAQLGSSNVRGHLSCWIKRCFEKWVLHNDLNKCPIYTHQSVTKIGNQIYFFLLWHKYSTNRRYNNTVLLHHTHTHLDLRRTRTYQG